MTTIRSFSLAWLIVAASLLARPAHAAPRSLLIKVLDAAGNPSPAANVALFAPQDTSDNSVSLQGVAVTDATGQVHMDALAGKLYVMATGPGASLMRQATVTPEAESVALTLATGRLAHFRLVDMQGKPINGVSVGQPALNRASVPTPEKLKFEHRLQNMVRLLHGKPGFPFEDDSAADGTVIRAVGAGASLMNFYLFKQGFQRCDLRFHLPQDEGLTVTMVEGATIRGRIVDAATGLPRAGLVVSDFSREQGAQTDEKGEFELKGLDEGSTFLTLPSVKDVVLPVRQLAPHRGQTLDLGDVKAGVGCLVTGALLEANGHPIRPQTVVARPAGEAGAPPVPWRQFAFIQPDGNYSIRLPEGNFELLAAFNGRTVRKPVSAKNGVDVNLDLQLRAEGVAAPLAVEEVPAAGGPLVDYVWGRVISMPGSKTVAGARVHVRGGDKDVGVTVTDAKGNWALGNLPTAGAGAQTLYTVTADLGGLVSPVVKANLASAKPMTVVLTQGQSLNIHVVDKAGAPVAGANVTVLKFQAATPRQGWVQMVDVAAVGQAATATVASDADGVATLKGMPPDVFAQIEVKHAGFADAIHTVALPRDEVTLEVPLEAVIEGYLKLADGTPVKGAPGVRMKAQAWSGIWMEFPQWRMSEVGPDGHFAIKNIPSLEMLGQPTYSPNLDLGIGMNDVKKIDGDATMQYVPPGRGYDVMLTKHDKEGQTQRWRIYIDGPGGGLKFKEGEHIQHDYVFKPLAVIKGKTTPRGSISYHDPASVYGDWQTTASADGSFELPVPIGDVTLHFNGGSQKVIGLKAQETRVVELQAEPGMDGGARDETQPRHFMLRVVGPEGATVPRPDITWSNDTGLGQVGLDGSADVWLPPGDDKLRISSQFLDKPLAVDVARAGNYARVRLDRRPPTVPPPAVQQDYQFPPDAMPGRKPAAVGDAAPELQVTHWSHGGPVSVAALKGKVVLVAFNMGGPALQAIAARFAGKPLAIVALNRSGMRMPRFYGQDMDPANWEESVLAVGDDPPGPRGEGVNAQAFGTTYGAAIIDSTGKLAAQGLNEPYVSAKIDQLLPLAPAGAP